MNRRMLLKGLGGTAIGLPLLEAMTVGGSARGQSATPPKRYLVAFGGFALGNDKLPMAGVLQEYVPTQVGATYTPPRGLTPLLGFGDVHTQVTVVSGLHIGGSTNPGPGERFDDGGLFHNHVNPLLTGNRQVLGGFLGGHDATVTGPSSDQVVAQAWANSTRFRSLHYQVQAMNYGSLVHPNQAYLSFAAGTSGGFAPVRPLSSPKLAFDTLFTGFTPTDPTQALAQNRALRDRKSILDLVDRRMGGLLPRLSLADRLRLDRHYQEIRQLEQLVASVPPATVGECKALPDPGADPALGGDSVLGTGKVVQGNGGYSDEDRRARIFCDLLHMAFTCDQARAATLLMTMFQSNMNFAPLTGHPYTLHSLGHEGDLAMQTDAAQWHVKQFGYLVSRLRDTPEAGGSVLDSCALVLLNEGGFGPTSTVVNSSHVTTNMVALVAGGAGRLKRGHHLATAGSHPAQLLVTLMNAVGVPATALGEVSGSIPALLA